MSRSAAHSLLRSSRPERDAARSEVLCKATAACPATAWQSRSSWREYERARRASLASSRPIASPRYTSGSTRKIVWSNSAMIASP